MQGGGPKTPFFRYTVDFAHDILAALLPRRITGAAGISGQGHTALMHALLTQPQDRDSGQQHQGGHEEEHIMVGQGGGFLY